VQPGGFCRNRRQVDSLKANNGEPITPMVEALCKVLKRMHYPLEVMLVCVRWYAAYPLSMGRIEKMMAERGVVVDHATVHRWAVKMLPVLAAVFRNRKKTVGTSWRVDETYIKVAGRWKFLCRAVRSTTRSYCSAAC
jgi:putative transposase